MRGMGLTTAATGNSATHAEPEATDTAMRRAAVVIPAAGRARRFGSPTNKIWAEIAGQSVLERTLTAFCRHPAISSIVIAAGAEEVEPIRALVAQVTLQFSIEVAVVSGGETR